MLVCVYGDEKKNICLVGCLPQTPPPHNSGSALSAHSGLLLLVTHLGFLRAVMLLGNPAVSLGWIIQS
jgi:hypothetical protein